MKGFHRRGFETHPSLDNFGKGTLINRQNGYNANETSRMCSFLGQACGKYEVGEKKAFSCMIDTLQMHLPMSRHHWQEDLSHAIYGARLQL